MPQTCKTKGETMPTTFVDLLEMDWEAGADVKVVCPACQGSFMHNEYLASVFPGTHCDDCCEAVMAKKVQESLVSSDPVALADVVTKTIPPLYLETDPERLPYQPRQEVLAWDYRPGAKGLWLVGDTRAGKTRTLCLLIERLLGEGVEVNAHFHGEFTDNLLEVMRSEKSYKALKFKLAKAQVLVIDDLFSGKLTERSESALFEILDERIAWKRPTLVTTQVTGKDAKARFHSQKRCQGFFSRVKEFFTIVPFSNAKQGGLEL